MKQQIKFFISYRRSVKIDHQLALFLCNGLQQKGHNVFIDVNMKIGTDWVSEIRKRVDWCDFLVVLISAESIRSEMVQGEVRLAHQKRKRDGTPQILPVRVQYKGPLDYELDSYLGRLQYAEWEKTDDSEKLIKILCNIAVGDLEQNGLLESRYDDLTQVTPSEEVQIKYHRPEPVVDPRVLRAPGGTIKFSDPLYIKRPADDMVEGAAINVGETLVIRAPRQTGKSSLMLRYLAACKKIGKFVVYLDFQSFSDSELEDYSTLLTEIATFLLRNLQIDASLEEPITTQRYLTYFIEDTVLKVVKAPLTLALDEVDRILGRPYQADFFSMLRLWHNRRAEPFSAWEEVDLGLVISTEPYLLIDSIDRSPFNVVPPIRLEPFPFKSMDEINMLYGAPLKESELEDLYDLLGGQPYLTRLAFYLMVGPAQISFDTMINRAERSDGPFSDHLKRILMLLDQQPGLLAAMQQLIFYGTVPDKDTYFRLHGIGLTRMEGDRVVPMNMLYARFFKEEL